MSTRIVLSLPDDLYQRAERLAHLTGRNVTDTLTDTLALLLPPLNTALESMKPVTELTDEEVLAASELQMAPGQDQRLSALLYRQQAGELSDAERAEVVALMQIYQERLLRKAQALRETVRRGLRAPLEP